MKKSVLLVLLFAFYALGGGTFRYNQLFVQRLEAQITEVNDFLVRSGQAPIDQDSLESIRNNAVVESHLEIQPDAYSSVFKSNISVLPIHVDNSLRKEFPPIGNQGPTGACQSFAYAYYMASYELAMVMGWDNSTMVDSQIVSPLWVYNQRANLLPPTDSEMGDVLRVHGTVFSDKMPYSYFEKDYLYWPADSALWEKALEYRVSEYYRDYAHKYTTNNLAPIKTWLANGHVFTVSTNISGYQYDVIKDDINTTAEDSLVGKNVVYRVSNTQTLGHMMVVVGYNDEVWVDVNANGTLDIGEKGAFKLANSWGSNWQENGFTWIAYDAIVNPSIIPVMNTRANVGSKIPGIQDFSWLQYDSQQRSKKLRARVTVEHQNRGSLMLTLGRADYESTVWKDSLVLPYFDYNGGRYSLDGSDTVKLFTFYVDLMPLAQMDMDQRFYLQLTNRYDYFSEDFKGTIHQFTVVDSTLNGEVELPALHTPLAVDVNEHGMVYVDYKWNKDTYVSMNHSKPMAYDQKYARMANAGSLYPIRYAVLPQQNFMTAHVEHTMQYWVMAYTLDGTELWKKNEVLAQGKNEISIPSYHSPYVVVIKP
jgi:C1A family cysteine protease